MTEMKKFDSMSDSPAAESLRTRRDLLLLAGSAGALLLVEHVNAQSGPAGKRANDPANDGAGKRASNAPACVLAPEQTEGPYFVDEHLNRADIRSDPATGSLRPGVPLALALRVQAINAGSCTPLDGALVDLWHCDAEGRYSDVPDRRSKARGEKFLRGYQVTDQSGRVQFATIYPGWYPGRAVHLHFKVRMQGTSRQALEFTSQLYFEETITDRVFAQAPYTRSGRRTRNDDDDIFSYGGAQLLLAPRANGAGYAAEFAVGVRLG